MLFSSSFFKDDVPLVEITYFVFTCMPDESYCRRLRSLLLCLCGVFRTLTNFLVFGVLLFLFLFGVCVCV